MQGNRMSGGVVKRTVNVRHDGVAADDGGLGPRLRGGDGRGGFAGVAALADVDLGHECFQWLRIH